MTSVCFTGHRNVVIKPTLKKELSQVLRKQIKSGAVDFYAGGAYGWDTICALGVLELRVRYPHIKLHLILPCPPAEQTQKWSEADKEVYQDILSAADTATICSEHYSNTCMKDRNARLVALSDCCVCWFNKDDYRSGTGQTVRMAQRKGITVINMYREQRKIRKDGNREL